MKLLNTIQNFFRTHFHRIKSGRLSIWQILIYIAITITGLTLLGILIFVIMIFILSIGLPDVKDLDKLNVAQSTTIYDREGNILYVKHGGENRQYVSFENISSNSINATIAIEDAKFWTHSGFNPVGIGRAVISNIFHTGIQQGGSTITQQYIKLTFLSTEKSYIRKMKELILAVRLEQAFDKKKILELYLNKIPYGNNAYGIEKAAQVYFNKHAKDLDIAEASILAALPQAPSYYNPFGSHLYSQITKQFTAEELAWRRIDEENDLKQNEFLRGLIGKTVKIGDTQAIYIQGRTDMVLKAMEKYGYITETQREEALTKLQNFKFNEYHEEIKHAHFVFSILDDLEQKYGKEIVEQGGLRVYTTLDPTLQNIAEKVVKEGALANEKKYNAKNAALVAIDPKTGEILAEVGSRNYFDKEIDGAVNVAEQFRQPGSSFKPIIYAQAFINRISPASIIFDTPLHFGSTSPKNFDGKFWGPMTIRKGLAQSRNIPAIKAYFLGGEQEPIKNLAEKMGITFMDRTRDYGWPLALGAAEVRLVDMVSAFGTFANNGVRHSPINILKVENANGAILEEYRPAEFPGEQVLDPQVAYLVSSILSDTSVRLSETMTVPGQINAAKTGTSNRKTAAGKYYPHDLWCMGYTTRLAAGVWSGNNRDDEGNISTAADGVNLAAPIWKKFMTEALSGKPSEQFPVPEGIKQVQISKISGKLPGPTTPAEQITSDVFASFAIPTEVDDSLTQTKIDSRNEKLANDYCPPAFVTSRSYVNLHDIQSRFDWDTEAQKWLQENTGKVISADIKNIFYGAPPTMESELCTEAAMNSRPSITIVEPSSGTHFPSGSTVSVKVNAASENSLEKVEFYLDNNFRYYADISPYEGIVRFPKNEPGQVKHIITVRAIDRMGYTTDSQIEVFSDAL